MNLPKNYLNLVTKYPSKYAACLNIEELKEDDAFFQPTTKRPINILPKETMKLDKLLFDERIIEYKKLLEAQGWQFYVVDQRRGACYYRDRRITIPLFAMKREPRYLHWYISHELSHAFAGHTAKHGEYFMEWLVHICPANSVHFEITYKPRNATMHGISDNERQNILHKEILNLTDADFI